MEKNQIVSLCICTLLEIAAIGISIVDNKEESRTHVYIDYMPEIEKTPKTKIDKTGIKKEASRTIDEFVNTLSRENINLTGFYRNMNSSRIVYIPNSEGYYDPIEKNLIVDPNNTRESLLRALIEMLATRTLNQTNSRTVVASGFERTVFDKEHYPEQISHIGYGLSQGYKDILLTCFFGLEGKYPMLSELAILIEDILGKKLMLKSFINGDLREINSLMIYQGLKPYLKPSPILLKMDNLYDAIYLDSPFRKIGINFTYRDLIIELSKQAVDKAKDYYNQMEIFYKARDESGNPSKGSIVEDILGHVDAILQTRKKQPLLLGLKPADVDSIVEYGKGQMRYLPEKYHLKG